MQSDSLSDTCHEELQSQVYTFVFKCFIHYYPDDDPLMSKHVAIIKNTKIYMR
jgi:hypothetical protein